MFTYVLFSFYHTEKKCRRLLWTVPYSFFSMNQTKLSNFFYNFLSLFQWIFGEDWCDGWHSFDVLASTASILNLCVISLDRYWAIEEPMSYPAKVSSINDVASLLHNFEPLPPHINFFLLLKVRKFQKQIIIFSILPKNTPKIFYHCSLE